MGNKLGKLVLVVLLLMFNCQYVVYAAETAPDLKKEIDELKRGQQALQKDMRMIILLLTQGQKPAQRPTLNVRGVEIELEDNPTQGSDAAPLVMLEFSDYQCSFCARHTKETYPEIYDSYINTGKLRYVFVDKPLPNHLMAFKAAEAAHCAAEQGKFLVMHEGMMADPESLNDMDSLASSLNIDMKNFRSCMEEKKYADVVTSNLALATKLKIINVPGFIIASSDPDNPQKVKGITYIRGAKPFTQFKKEIDQALAGLSK